MHYSCHPSIVRETIILNLKCSSSASLMGRPGFSSDIGLPETASMSQAKFFIAA